jgi:hypothetical protein
MEFITSAKFRLADLVVQTDWVRMPCPSIWIFT